MYSDTLNITIMKNYDSNRYESIVDPKWGLSKNRNEKYCGRLISLITYAESTLKPYQKPGSRLIKNIKALNFALKKGLDLSKLKLPYPGLLPELPEVIRNIDMFRIGTDTEKKMSLNLKHMNDQILGHSSGKISKKKLEKNLFRVPYPKIMETFESIMKHMDKHPNDDPMSMSFL